jgi:hypothetical protein
MGAEKYEALSLTLNALQQNALKATRYAYETTLT